MTLGPIAFLSPWLLAGLLALPVIWWLLRTVPPRPQRVEFPPTRILVGLDNREKTPAKTPWWLTLIRMLAAALVILALAEPVLNPNRTTALTGSGPVVLVVDNGWAAAAQWGSRTSMIERLIAEAEGQSRPVMIVATASATKSPAAKIEAPGAARSTAAAIQPQPFAPDRPAAAEAIVRALGGAAEASIVWLSDGIDHDGTARAFTDRLAALAGVRIAVVETRAGYEALGTSATVTTGGRLEAQVLRAEGGVRSGVLHAVSARGQRLGQVAFTLNAGDTRAISAFDLPLELRNQVTRIEIAGERSAGAVHLLDARSRWHRVGVYSSESREQAQPLLAPLYYIERALTPFTEIARGEGANLPAAIDSIMKRNVSVLMLADVGVLPPRCARQASPNGSRRAACWCASPGRGSRRAATTCFRSRCARAAARSAARCRGRRRNRWCRSATRACSQACRCRAEVVVSKQVLADPASLGADVKVWARLKDGTPLVTAAKRGDGQLDLLPRHRQLRLVEPAAVGPVRGDAPPHHHAGQSRRRRRRGARRRRQDGRRRVGRGGALAAAGARRVRPAQEPAADHAGHRRLQDRRGQAQRREPAGLLRTGRRPAGPQSAHAEDPCSSRCRACPAGVERRVYEGEAAQPVKPQLLVAAMTLLFADILAVLLLQAGGLGGLVGRMRTSRRPRRRRARRRRAGRRPADGWRLAGQRPGFDRAAQHAPTRCRRRPGHVQGHVRLCRHRRCRHRRDQPRRPRSASTSI